MLIVSVSWFRWSAGSDGCWADDDEPDHALHFQRDTSATSRSQWKEPVWLVN